MSHSSCDVFGCSSKAPMVKCFAFPQDKARRMIWEEFCQSRKFKKGKYICAKHFDLKYFNDGSRSKNLLKSSNPIPTLEPPTSTLVSVSQCSSETTDDADMEGVSSQVAPSSSLPSTSFPTTSCCRDNRDSSSSFSPSQHPLTFSYFL